MKDYLREVLWVIAILVPVFVICGVVILIGMMIGWWVI